MRAAEKLQSSTRFSKGLVSPRCTCRNLRNRAKPRILYDMQTNSNFLRDFPKESCLKCTRRNLTNLDKFWDSVQTAEMWQFSTRFSKGIVSPKCTSRNLRNLGQSEDSVQSAEKLQCSTRFSKGIVSPKCTCRSLRNLEQSWKLF